MISVMVSLYSLCIRFVEEKLTIKTVRLSSTPLRSSAYPAVNKIFYATAEDSEVRRGRILKYSTLLAVHV
jgi:hypothetical protein